jgi:hypothetical protein
MCFEKGLGTEKEIDAVAVKALGLGVGPFTALNLTGGNPITAHGLDEMGKLLLPWFKTPAILHEKTRKKESWNSAQRGEKVDSPLSIWRGPPKDGLALARGGGEVKEEMLVKEFQGAYFALASYILGLGIVNINDLNMACELALVLKALFSFMNEIGISKAYSLVKNFCENHPSFPFPKILEKAK